MHKNHQETRDIVRGYQLEFGQEFGEDIRSEISEQFECLSTCTGEGDGENHSASHQMARKTLSPCQAAEGRHGQMGPLQHGAQHKKLLPTESYCGGYSRTAKPIP